MDSMTGLSIVSTSHAHAHPHMTTHIRIRMDIGSSSESTEHSRGGHPCSLCLGGSLGPRAWGARQGRAVTCARGGVACGCAAATYGDLRPGVYCASGA